MYSRNEVNRDEREPTALSLVGKLYEANQSNRLLL
jgi:hypothetical protein